MSAQLSVGIIGAWLGGLALGILLSRSDFHGGTWRINTYPGLACDVKSHLYSALDRQRR
ncbi:MAG: cyclohexanone monooxygenase [Mycobacterium sp.]|jgi:cyclohexanone monooxygenase|nr:cyclohexanone monooxygenase [Mycobacterium sp.]